MGYTVLGREKEMSRKAVIFDLDGTVMDTYQGIYDSACGALVELGLPEADPVAFRRFIGPPLRQSFQQGCGLTDPELLDKAVPLFLRNYHDYGFKRATVYPGLVDLLCGLRDKGVYLAVATMKIETVAQRLLGYHGLLDWFDAVRGSDDSYTRTKSSNIMSILSESEICCRDAVMVGDTAGDEEAARMAGICCVRVDYGYGFAAGSDGAYPMEDICGVLSEMLGL